MTTTATRTDATLTKRAERLVANLGKLPSQRELASHLRIGRPKAKAILDALSEPSTAPPDVVPEPLATESAEAISEPLPVPVEEPTSVPEQEPNPADSEPFTEPLAKPLEATLDTKVETIPEPLVPELGIPEEMALSAGEALIDPVDLVDLLGPLPEPRPALIEYVEVPTPVAPEEPSTEPPTVVPSDSDSVASVAVPEPRKKLRRWPLAFLVLPAFIAIWSGWVGLGEMAGFGIVHPLPGIVDSFTLNSAITLPIGVEAYAAYALYVWLSGAVAGRALRFAKTSAIASLITGALGQVAYHLLAAAGVGTAPWWITTAVACLPVAVLGMGAALAHITNKEN